MTVDLSSSLSVDLSGKVAIVTGAGRGIGRAIAVAYAAAGADVVLTARTPGEIDEVAASIEAVDGRALPVVADAADRSATRRLVAETIDAFGRIDLVVANAGIVASPDDSPEEAFAAVVGVNLLGVHDLARATEAHLRIRGGKFLVIGSGAGRRPFRGGAAYSVSKAGVSMLVRVLAVEWREVPIAVNELIPGPVRTRLAGSLTGLTNAPTDVRLDWHKAPEDVVPMALFLAGLPDDGPSGQVFSLLGRDG